jgi:hypothetical protein
MLRQEIAAGLESGAMREDIIDDIMASDIFSEARATLIADNRIISEDFKSTRLTRITISSMSTTVFYSWQSDRPEDDCRYFIEDALKAAIKALARDIEFQEAVREPIVFDKDTKDEPGFVKIFETILEKIGKATVFVPDLTFVAQRPKGEPTPNPNVLIEYGYALRAYGQKGERRIMPVMNNAYGKPSRQTMPFDLLERRNAITYDLPEGADIEARNLQLKELTGKLQNGLKTFFASDFYKDTQPKPPAPALREDRKPRYGKARFRSETEDLGFYQDPVASLIGSTERQRVYLADGPAMWLRVATQFAPDKNVNVTQVAGLLQTLAVLPLFDLGTSSGQVLASDGAGYFKFTDEKKTPQVVFAFTDGEVWTIDTWTLRALPKMIVLNEPRFAQSLQMSADFLSRLGFKGPYRWIAGMEGVNGRFISSSDGTRKWGPCMSDTMAVPGTFNLTDDPADALEPFFERVYDQCTAVRPPRPKR